jgi:carbonic anhydrase/acetyltransferase-like protein (isoleucine patch superfamily)
MVLAFEGEEPQVAEGVYVAENATLVGAVSIGEGSSVWFGAVLRADQNRIRVGRRSNIQDNAVLHADPPDYPGSPLVLGDDVTVGHAAVLHGCRIGDGAVIGSGSIVLDGAEIGAGALLGAGALVPPGAGGGCPREGRTGVDGRGARGPGPAVPGLRVTGGALPQERRRLM